MLLANWCDGTDKHYKTIANKKNSAITGLSMGGHGALYLAFKRQDIFSTAGSMSGGVDIRPFPLKWAIAKSLGSYAESKDAWDANTVIELTHLLTPNSLSLIIQCGTEDFFYNVNVKPHEKLLLNSIPHTFISNPGAHNWDYWKEAIHYQLLYIYQRFGIYYQKVTNVIFRIPVKDLICVVRTKINSVEIQERCFIFNFSNCCSCDCY